MRFLHFARRNLKEMLRDPLSLIFGLGFPLALLLLLSAIQRSVPVELFRIESLAPGVAVFGLSFIALFAALLISKDRASALMARLMASPLTAWDFILGYTLPLLPMAVVQTIFCYAVALALGLPLSAHIPSAAASALPSAIFFIAMGLLLGSVLNDKQVGGVCGALMTNLCAWLSGAWFDPALVGGPFETIARALPFYPSVTAGRAALSHGLAAAFPDLWLPIAYAAAFLCLAVAVFYRRMRAGRI